MLMCVLVKESNTVTQGCPQMGKEGLHRTPVEFYHKLEKKCRYKSNLQLK